MFGWCEFSKLNNQFCLKIPKIKAFFKSKINLLRIDSVKKEIVNELTNCKITIFNNTDLNINMLFENNLITVIDKKYNSLYLHKVLM